ncbi:hypothetical protein D9756_007232 [Leucocoprinus leucothites]|uniref:Uncharacterized protein n=1 Tax=Leucocoprinus leucothites TaxID=201217 RepID=A0A8H5D8K0_9AGAR|nr:hypothetical protein D9756_007232 [Leucoagaricus leucothites]
MSSSGSGSTPTSPSADPTYPEQRHAGKVGYGPNYKQGATMMDKISGLSEEIHGKLAHKPELVQEGREKKTGELRRKKNHMEDEKDPFATPGESKSTPSHEGSSTSIQSDQPSSRGSSGAVQTASPERMSSTAYSSGSGAREQAATVAPPDAEGTDTTRLTQARSEGVKSLSEAQERPQ